MTARQMRKLGCNQATRRVDLSEVKVPILPASHVCGKCDGKIVVHATGLDRAAARKEAERKTVAAIPICRRSYVNQPRSRGLALLSFWLGHATRRIEQPMIAAQAHHRGGRDIGEHFDLVARTK
jgi:hypothetical protein